MKMISKMAKNRVSRFSAIIRPAKISKTPMVIARSCMNGMLTKVSICWV